MYNVVNGLDNHRSLKITDRNNAFDTKDVRAS